MTDRSASARWATLRALIEEALTLPAEQRLPFLRSSVTDPALLAEAEQLLAFDQQASKMFSLTGWREQAAIAVSEEPLAGTELGSYRILHEIGRGGMGAVYLAERADGAYQQKVAVKLLQESMSTPDLQSRFLAERQILAQLKHPGIVRLLDGGVTAAGRPFLVLEYVDGVPIDRYCDNENLDLTARLKLFLKVADAIQAAHQQLTLHLDLKPANIMITADGEPHLLDFGIARLLGEGGTTQPSLMLMTPRYASPEQAEGKPLGVASDIFSLATLLYKLLTGVLPYPIENASPLEAARMIREATPVAPSRLTFGATAAALRGDLDMILLQALRKEPERRYPTVAAFAEDVRSHLASRPVSAHRDSVMYRSRKFLRRNWISAAAVAAVLVVLAGSAVSILRSAHVAQRQRGLAVQAEQVAEQQKVAALHAEAEAERQRGLALQSAALAEQSASVAERQKNAALQAQAEADAQRNAAQTSEKAAQQRLGDVRSIANSAIVDVIPALEDIPGTLDLRQKLVAESLKYLNGMKSAMSSDPDFDKEVARGFYTMGELQGYPQHPNYGDRAGAIASYQSAIEIENRTLARNPNDLETLGRIALGYSRIANIYNSQGNLEESMKFHRIADGMFERVLTGRKTTRWMQIANEYYYMAHIYDVSSQFNYADPETALKYITRALALVDEFGEAQPKIRSLQRFTVERVYIQQIHAGILNDLGRRDEAVNLLLEQIPPMEELKKKGALENDDNDATVRADTYRMLAEDALQHDKPAEAAAYLAKIGPLPKNSLPVVGDGIWEANEATVSNAFAARVEFAQGNSDSALQTMKKALAASRDMRKRAADLTWPTITLLHHLIEFGNARGMPVAESRAMLTEAVEIAAAYTKQHPEVLSSQLDEAQAHIGLARIAKETHDASVYRSESAAARTILARLRTLRPANARIAGYQKTLDEIES